MAEAKLKRTLGLAECIFFGVGSILGAGIYALIGKVAGFGGNTMWLAFLIASFTAVLTAFSYAELSAAFPKSGGEYVYVKNAAGRKAAAFFGSLISANGIVSGATVSLGFAGYFSQLMNVNLLPAALGIIALILLINISGIRESSVVNIIFTVIEMGGLFFVIYSAFPYLGKVNYTELPPEGTHGLMTAAALSFFAYIGFEDIVKLAAETKNPEKNMPRALFSASAIVMAVYTLVAICAVSVIPWQELGESKSPLADIVRHESGRTGAVIISVIALFSTSNTILSNMIGSSRVMLGMAAEIKLFRTLGYISPKTKTPVAALILIALLMASISLIRKIEMIALIANFFIFSTFLMVNVSVIILRIKNKDLKRPFRIPGNIGNIPLIPFAGIAMTLVMIAYSVYGLIRS